MNPPRHLLIFPLLMARCLRASQMAKCSLVSFLLLIAVIAPQATAGDLSILFGTRLTGVMDGELFSCTSQADASIGIYPDPLRVEFQCASAPPVTCLFPSDDLSGISYDDTGPGLQGFSCQTLATTTENGIRFQHGPELSVVEEFDFARLFVQVTNTNGRVMIGTQVEAFDFPECSLDLGDLPHGVTRQWVCFADVEQSIQSRAALSWTDAEGSQHSETDTAFIQYRADQTTVVVTPAEQIVSSSGRAQWLLAVQNDTNHTLTDLMVADIGGPGSDCPLAIDELDPGYIARWTCRSSRVFSDFMTEFIATSNITSLDTQSMGSTTASVVVGNTSSILFFDGFETP